MPIEIQIEKRFDLCKPLCLKSIRAINKLFREVDESHLWPISNRFDVTERAIRWYSRVYLAANGPCMVIEYITGIEGRISEIVNNV